MREDSFVYVHGGVKPVFDVKTVRFLAVLGLTKTHARRQRLFNTVKPILPLFQSASVEGRKKGLIGYQPNINTLSNCWNCGSWYWAG